MLMWSILHCFAAWCCCCHCCQIGDAAAWYCHCLVLPWFGFIVQKVTKFWQYYCASTQTYNNLYRKSDRKPSCHDGCHGQQQSSLTQQTTPNHIIIAIATTKRKNRSSQPHLCSMMMPLVLTVP